MFRHDKAPISADLAGVFERLGSSAEAWEASLNKLSGGRLLGRFFAGRRERLHQAASHLGVHHLANLDGCPAGEPRRGDSLTSTLLLLGRRSSDARQPTSRDDLFPIGAVPRYPEGTNCNACPFFSWVTYTLTTSGSILHSSKKAGRGPSNATTPTRNLPMQRTRHAQRAAASGKARPHWRVGIGDGNCETERRAPRPFKLRRRRPRPRVGPLPNSNRQSSCVSRERAANITARDVAI